MQDIKFLEGDAWGRRKDIDEHVTIPDEALNAIRSMTKKGIATEESTSPRQRLRLDSYGCILHPSFTSKTTILWPFVKG